MPDKVHRHVCGHTSSLICVSYLSAAICGRKWLPTTSEELLSHVLHVDLLHHHRQLGKCQSRYPFKILLMLSARTISPLSLRPFKIVWTWWQGILLLAFCLRHLSNRQYLDSSLLGFLSFSYPMQHKLTLLLRERYARVTYRQDGSSSDWLHLADTAVIRLEASTVTSVPFSKVSCCWAKH